MPPAFWLLLSAYCLLPTWLALSATAPAPAPQPGVHYVDITRQAGINFVHYTGAFGKKYLPETMGAGCAFIDYDNDGNPDILLINGADFPGHKLRRTTLKLYRNNGNGTFTDVTAKAGLDVEMYGMGVAVGDYDNDGWDDLYVTGLGEARLFHNEHGHFQGRDASGRRQQHGLWRQRRLGGLRPGRQARSFRDQLREVVGEGRPVLHAGWAPQILLHAGSLQGRHLPAVPQSGQRAL